MLELYVSMIGKVLVLGIKVTGLLRIIFATIVPNPNHTLDSTELSCIHMDVSLKYNGS